MTRGISFHSERGDFDYEVTRYYDGGEWFDLPSGSHLPTGSHVEVYTVNLLPHTEDGYYRNVIIIGGLDRFYSLDDAVYELWSGYGFGER